MKAQDQLRAMMKEQIAPALRFVGLKGSGAQFYLPDESLFLLLGLQSSSSNTAESVRFTFNVSAMNRADWQERWGQRHAHPSGNVNYGRFQWHERIGRLMGRGDVWWTLDSSALDRDLVCAVVEDALLRYAVPALVARRDDHRRLAGHPENRECR